MKVIHRDAVLIARLDSGVLVSSGVHRLPEGRHGRACLRDVTITIHDNAMIEVAGTQHFFHECWDGYPSMPSTKDRYNSGKYREDNFIVTYKPRFILFGKPMPHIIARYNCVEMKETKPYHAVFTNCQLEL